MLLTKINKLLTINQKKFLPFIFFIFIFSMLLETLSIALIFPFIELIQDQQLSDSNFFLSDIIIFICNSLNIDLLPLICLFILLILIIKSFFLIFSYNIQAKFSSSILIEQSNIFFNLYIRQSWIYHANRNSSLFIRNIISEVGNFMGFTEAAIIIAAESFIFIGIVCLLFFIDFYITFYTFFTILFLSIIFNLLSKSF